MRAWRTSPKRRIKQYCFNAFCIIACALSLLGLLSILWSLIAHGLPAIHLDTITQNTPPPGQAGGLLNAIIGTCIMTGLAILIAAPFGIGIATFLVDYSGKNRLAKSVRFVNDVLLSAPSIVIGLFVYVLIVEPMGHFSGLAGAIALAMIALPMIVRATEDVLYLVSPLLKEAAIAMGIARWRVIFKIAYRVAIHGIITAVLLAVARIAGETAPLLFTALNNQFGSSNLLKPMASLPVVIYQYAMSPYSTWQHLAWAGAILITAVILLLNLFARTIAKGSQR